MPPTRRAGRGAQGRLQCPPAPCPTLRRGQGPEDARTTADPARGAASRPNSWVPWSCSHRDQGWFLVPFGDLPGGGASLENTPPKLHSLLAPKLLSFNLKWGPIPSATPRSHRTSAQIPPPPPHTYLEARVSTSWRKRGCGGEAISTHHQTRSPTALGLQFFAFSPGPHRRPHLCALGKLIICFPVLPRIHPKSLPPPPHPHHSHSSQELTPVSTPPLLSSVHTIPPGHSAQLCR